MASGLIATVRRYAHNIITHGKRVLRRKESLRQACEGIANDSGKLVYAFRKGAQGEERERAIKYVKRGRKAYNQHEYDVAEHYFRQAIERDATCGLAHTYLGHTLYLTNQLEAAVKCWEEAIRQEPRSDAARKAEEKLKHVRDKSDSFKSWMRGESPD